MPSAPLPDRVFSWLSALRPAPQTAARGRVRAMLCTCLSLPLAGGLGHASVPTALPGLVALVGSSADPALAELVPMASATGRHPLPIFGALVRLVGFVTPPDLVKALSHGP